MLPNDLSTSDEFRAKCETLRGFGDKVINKLLYTYTSVKCGFVGYEENHKTNFV